MKYTGHCSGLSCTKAALIVSSDTDKYNCKGKPSMGRLMIGGRLIISFIC